VKRFFIIVLSTISLLFSGCNTAAPISKVEPIITEEEFVLEPSSDGLQAASVSTTTPRLVVRLSIQPELDKLGNPTGKRYGQAAFFWTDKSRTNGGSNLGGIISLVLRNANNLDGSQYLTYNQNPILSNRDLYSQANYHEHIAVTSAVSDSEPLCVEVWGMSLVSTNGYRFYEQMEFNETLDSRPVLSLCEKKSLKTGIDLRLYRIKDRMFSVPSGAEFPFSIAVANNGSSTAKDVTVTYKIPYAEKLTFVRDNSGLFECSATTTQTNTEGLVMNISCYAEKMNVVMQTLPLIFSTTKDAPAYNNLLEFYMNISTSSPETDTTNNEADSYILLG
jgi:Domain of unknown function DUF11